VQDRRTVASPAGGLLYSLSQDKEFPLAYAWWHFRDYHLLLDEQAEQLFDAIAERARKIGEPTLRSIGDITRHQRLNDSDTSEIDATAMLQFLCDDNATLAGFMRKAHEVCDAAGDLATASLLENWIDEAERRSWFLSATINPS
jgi:starvation-inducible DNA-binding protein